MQEQITAALQKLGPSGPSAIAKELGVAKVDTVGYQLRRMLEKKLLKCAGTSADRRYALPDQKLTGATPPPAAQGEARPEEGESGTGRAARRALHPGGRRHLAADHRQRRRALHLHRAADRGDRGASLPALRQGLT